MAWIEGVEIAGIRLIPDSEPGEYAAMTQMKCPGSNPEDWTFERIVSHMRITMAGPEGDKRGRLLARKYNRAPARQEQRGRMPAVQVATRANRAMEETAL